MASTTIESSVSEHTEVSTAATILRNDDPLSQALREGLVQEVDDIARLSRAVSPPYDTLSSVVTSDPMVFSSRGHSTTTKPTSAGTSYPTTAPNGKGKHKLKRGYASSLSVTHGSASEAEVVQQGLRRNSLIAVGDWADAELEPCRPLMGTVRARDRQHVRRRPKQKKPVVVIEQGGRARASSEESGLMLMTAPSYGSTDKRYLRRRAPKNDEDLVRLAEEGQSRLALSQRPNIRPISWTRLYFITGLVTLKLLIVAVSAYGTYLTGRTRMSCTKGIVLTATAVLSYLTVVTMLLARRTISEALLAGLIEFVVGFALVVGLDDFL